MRKPSSLHIPVWTQLRLRWGMTWPTNRPGLTRRQLVIGVLCLTIAYNYLGKWTQETRATQAEQRLKRYERPRVSASLDVTHLRPAPVVQLPASAGLQSKGKGTK
jgi:hypothetical protein